MAETLSKIAKKHQNWLLLLLYCTCTVVGSIGAPFLQRIYYLHGGSLRWFTSFLLSIGFLILIPPLTFLYFKSKLTSSVFFMDFKLFLFSATVGTLYGFVNYLASIGMSYLPLSTLSLIGSTQLAFTAFFAFLIVKQKISFYSANSVLVISFGALVLGLHSNSDRPVGVTKEKYYLGFFCTLAMAALGGLSSPLIELAYSKSTKRIDFSMLLQIQVVANAAASLFCAVGLSIRNDFKEIPDEAKNFALGEGKYYLVTIASAIVCQLSFLGIVGIIQCKSSLFGGIFNSGLLPIIEVASLLTFHEKFTGDKILSLGLCLWGFASYFVGESKKTRESNPVPENTFKESVEDGRIDQERQNQIEMNQSSEKLKGQEISSLNSDDFFI